MAHQPDLASEVIGFLSSVVTRLDLLPGSRSVPTGGNRPVAE
jgi:hypothetical protein